MILSSLFAALTVGGAIASTPAAAAAPPSLSSAAEAFRTFRDGVAAGTPRYDRMTSGLATRMRAVRTENLVLFEQLGDVRRVQDGGATADGQRKLVVAFGRSPHREQTVAFYVGLDETGRLARLSFEQPLTPITY